MIGEWLSGFFVTVGMVEDVLEAGTNEFDEEDDEDVGGTCCEEVGIAEV